MMRFFEIWRLTNRRRSSEGFASHRSFVLMEEFKTLDDEARRLRGAGLLSPMAVFTRCFLNPNTIDGAATERWQELMSRYEGVLYQMLYSQAVPVAEAVDKVSEVLFAALDFIRSEGDARRYPVVLWNAYVAVMGSAPSSLKPKFMLRAFVDEIQAGIKQGVLIDVSYRGEVPSNVSTQELRRAMRLGCELLHGPITAMDTGLDRVTDQALRFSELSRLDNAAASLKYETWLMR